MLSNPPTLPIRVNGGLPPNNSVKAGLNTSEQSPKSAASKVQPSQTTRKTNHWYLVIAPNPLVCPFSTALLSTNPLLHEDASRYPFRSMVPDITI